MKSPLHLLRAAVGATAVLALVCGGAYPLLVFAVAQSAFPRQARGSLVADPDGTVRGSAWIAQPFHGPAYFHPRPSAAGNGYDAASSGGSNLGPTSRKLADLIEARIAAYRTENGLGGEIPVPADAVTASGSGLDPHISPRNAELQAARVARVRGLEVDAVRRCIRSNTVPPQAGFLGRPVVHVLRLNRALDGRLRRWRPGPG